MAPEATPALVFNRVLAGSYPKVTPRRSVLVSDTERIGFRSNSGRLFLGSQTGNRRGPSSRQY
jgi:hypothetical protein